jgi:hypothetical protein
MTNVKRFLTEREATLKLGINDRTFRKYRVMGLIAPVGVVGSGRFIFEADYIEFQSFQRGVVHTSQDSRKANHNNEALR